MASRSILSNFIEEPWTQNHPQYLSGLLRGHFFRQPFSKYLYTNGLDDTRAACNAIYQKRISWNKTLFCFIRYKFE